MVRDAALRLTASRAAPETTGGPVIGSWSETVDYFRQRPRGYVLSSGELHPVETTQQPVQLWPLRVSVQDPGLVIDSLGISDMPGWPLLHSAWLCPEVPYEFELSTETLRESLSRAPVPAAADPAMFHAARGVARRVAA